MLNLNMYIIFDLMAIAKIAKAKVPKAKIRKKMLHVCKLCN